MRRGGKGGDPLISKEDALDAFKAEFDKRLDWDKVMSHARKSADDDTAAMMDESPDEWKDRLLDSAWHAMVTGERKASPGMDLSGIYEGGLNIAKKVSEDRLFYFKSGSDWQAVMQKYGAARTMYENFMLSANQTARQYSIMRFWGPSARANAQRVFDDYIAKNRDVDPDGVVALRKSLDSRGGFWQQFGRMDGSLNIPVHEEYASLFQGVRMYYDTTMLGGVGLTHFMSLPATLSSAIRYMGGSRLEGLGTLARALYSGRSAAEASDLAAELGVYGNAVSRPYLTDWKDMDWPGRLSYLHSKYLDATGVHYFLDNAQRAMRELAAHTLARESDRGAWGENAKLTKALSRYGIDEGQWGMLKSLARSTDEDGHGFITPADARGADAGLVEQYLRDQGKIGEKATPEQIAAQVASWQRDFGDRLGMFYQDMSDMSTVTSGVRESALMKGDSRPGGSLLSEAMGTFWMFKSWPIAAFNQMFMREIYQAIDGRDMAFGIGGIVASTMIGGYLRMVVRAYADGKPVPNPADPATVLAAIAQGGGFGIMGDLAFGEVNRSGGDALSSMAGPAFSDMSALMKAGSVQELLKGFSHYKQQMDQGKIESVWPSLATWAKNHVPGNNLIYLKGAIDYLMWYHVLDALKPGWWERANQQMIKERGSPMAGYMPGAGVPWSPWGNKTYSPPNM